jgi:hypothetical protein
MLMIASGAPPLFIHADRSEQFALVSAWFFESDPLPATPTLPSLGELMLAWI